MRTYTKESILRMRQKRKAAKSHSNSNLNDQQYQQQLGDLRGAGHLFSKVGQIHIYDDAESSEMIVRIPYKKTMYNGNAPQLVGYLVSASRLDKEPYKVRCWINKDRRIRFEVITHEND